MKNDLIALLLIVGACSTDSIDDCVTPTLTSNKVSGISAKSVHATGNNIIPPCNPLITSTVPYCVLPILNIKNALRRSANKFY